ncbi:MAG: T9SS C-terminal target domain-containing protein, partial [Bacteroidetes bacterium]
TLSNTSDALTIAQAAYGASSYLNGNVDEVRIWNAARTEQQIQEYMYRSLEGSESGLAAYYRFDDATGSTLDDKTSNANDGTIANMESSDWGDATAWEAGKVWTADGNWSALSTWLTYSIPNATTTPVYLFNDVEMNNSVNASQLVIASGTTVNFQSGFTLTLARDFVNHGTTTGTGGLAFNGSAAIQVNGTGSTSIGTFDSNNATGVTLGQSITVEDELRLSRGALTIGANTITVNEQITRTSGSFTGSASSNIVIGSPLGASTNLPGVTLQNLTVNRENGIILTGNVTVNSTLTMNDAKVFVSDFVLTLGNTATITGTAFSGSNMIVVETTVGSLRKNFPSAGSFLFPVGDQTGYYTPITLTFTGGSYASGYAAVNLQVIKHPDNSSATHFINRYWSIASSGISGFSCDISAIYDDVDIEGDEAEYYGGKWDGSAWTVLNQVDVGANEITGTVTSFSDYTAGEYSVFPLEWLAFTAEPTENEVLLNWTTAREQNTSHFEIERSADNETWKKIGREKAAGSTKENQNYMHTDDRPLAGTAYYRLRQVDLDGKNSFSNVVEVQPIDQELRIYPNPVSDILHVNLGQGRAEIMNNLGQTVAKYMLAEGENDLTMSQLTPGSYVLRVQTTAGVVRTFKFVKQ